MLKRNRKRNNKKRNGGYRMTALGYTSIQPVRFTGLSPVIKMTFKYVQTFAFTNLTTVAQNQVFRLNSLFDPDVTGAGHQPYLYDQMIDKYNRYRVLKTKWKIVYSAGSQSTHVGVVPTNGSLQAAVTTQVTYESAIELPWATSNIASGPGSPSTHFRGSVSLNVLNGTPLNEYLTDERFAAFTTADPTEVLRLNVLSYNSNATTTTVFCNVELEYEAILSDPIIVPISFERSSLIKRIKNASESEVVSYDKLLHLVI
jgi:hypothetical protein